MAEGKDTSSHMGGEVMGVGYHFICNDCKQLYYLGYGSYTTWLITDSVENYDAVMHQRPSLCTYRFGQLNKNKNIRKCLKKHQRHDFRYLNDDFYDINNKDIHEWKHEGTEFYLDVSDYEYIDLCGE